jgi:carboxyl-terminal processing protease
MAVGMVALGAVLLCTVHRKAPEPRAVQTAPSASVEPGEPAEHGPPNDETHPHAFRIPTGQAPGLSCEAARAVVAQTRRQLAYAPHAVDAKAFAEAAADWLDPYGLWSVAPDTPLAASFVRHAATLLSDVEGRGSAHCATAVEIGAELMAWIGELRTVFDEALARGPEAEDAQTAASAPAFEGASVTRPARALAATLGRRVGTVERELGAVAAPYADRARIRYFPVLDREGWAQVVLAAAVRAYVPTIDPHGAWAPIDEESSVYEVDLEARPPSRLWDKSERTAVGLKIESGASPPLLDGDVVLSLAGVATGGLSFEQAEQLGFAVSDAHPPAQAIVLRAGEKLPLTTWLDGTSAESKGHDGVSEEADSLQVERVEYGDGDALLVTIPDVRDDLGDSLARVLLRHREQQGRAVVGLVLDLRGNGGGSTDGAIDALGLFIPGAPLFPMKRRDGSLETDRAPEPPLVDRWRGPVASFIDGDTASAAEMIAGALTAYRRGVTVGARSFGKGCAQEYLDDDVHEGTLRLTTLLYALPDGTPVQRVGLRPMLHFPFGGAETGNDRESILLHAPPAWRGPDVRDRSVLAHARDGTWAVAWPPHGGNVGPCKDADACRALRLLGPGAPMARRMTRGRPSVSR